MDIGVQLAATDGRGLTGVLTVIGTLAFVVACFVVVELLDRRSAGPTPSSRTDRSSHDLGVDGPMADVSSSAHPFGFGVDRQRVSMPVPMVRAVTASLLGVLVAVAVGGLLVPVRATVGQAGIALSLVLVVVASAAVGGRTAAAVTSAGAALTFNLLHTEPYLTFHIDRSTDVVASVLMIVVGVAVGSVSQRRTRSGAAAPPTTVDPSTERTTR